MKVYILVLCVSFCAVQNCLAVSDLIGLARMGADTFTDILKPTIHAITPSVLHPVVTPLAEGINAAVKAPFEATSLLAKLGSSATNFAITPLKFGANMLDDIAKKAKGPSVSPEQQISPIQQVPIQQVPIQQVSPEIINIHTLTNPYNIMVLLNELIKSPNLIEPVIKALLQEPYLLEALLYTIEANAQLQEDISQVLEYVSPQSVQKIIQSIPGLKDQVMTTVFNNPVLMGQIMRLKGSMHVLDKFMSPYVGGTGSGSSALVRSGGGSTFGNTFGTGGGFSLF